MNRRYFIGATLATAAAGKAVAANDKVNIGMIGVGGRGVVDRSGALVVSVDG